MLSLLWFPTTRCEDSAGGASYEAGLNQRTIVLEFDSVERAIAAFNGDAYKAALKVLGNGAERDIRLVEGVA